MAKIGTHALVAATLMFCACSAANASPYHPKFGDEHKPGSPITIFDLPGVDGMSELPLFDDAAKPRKRSGWKCGSCDGSFVSYVFRPSSANAGMDDEVMASARVPSVPVPAALPLLGMALAGLGGLAMRKRKAG